MISFVNYFVLAAAFLALPTSSLDTSNPGLNHHEPIYEVLDYQYVSLATQLLVLDPFTSHQPLTTVVIVLMFFKTFCRLRLSPFYCRWSWRRGPPMVFVQGRRHRLRVQGDLQ
mmetsp:Transcript_29607/g.49112  ORF Transcript_29607/g.49112 Transcript_29607/m.49112 type:complete len:113 (+) Transcript_29607:94-432(+)